MQGLSALSEATLLCTQPFFFFVYGHLPTAAATPFAYRLRFALQSRQSMRQVLVEGRSDAANARVARHWYGHQLSRRAGH